MCRHRSVLRAREALSSRPRCFGDRTRAAVFTSRDARKSRSYAPASATDMNDNERTVGDGCRPRSEAPVYVRTSTLAAGVSNRVTRLTPWPPATRRAGAESSTNFAEFPSGLTADRTASRDGNRTDAYGIVGARRHDRDPFRDADDERPTAHVVNRRWCNDLRAQPLTVAPEARGLPHSWLTPHRNRGSGDPPADRAR
jgi:hypothetical protein